MLLNIWVIVVDYVMFGFSEKEFDVFLGVGIVLCLVLVCDDCGLVVIDVDFLVFGFFVIIFGGMEKGE